MLPAWMAPMRPAPNWQKVTTARVPIPMVSSRCCPPSDKSLFSGDQSNGIFISARRRPAPDGKRPMAVHLTEHRRGFGPGFTAITRLDEAEDATGIALGVLRLGPGESHAAVP